MLRTPCLPVLTWQEIALLNSGHFENRSFPFCGIELILDPEAVDNDAGAGIHPIFEGGHPADQIVGCGQ
jgi:hypothetical protein